MDSCGATPSCQTDTRQSARVLRIGAASGALAALATHRLERPRRGTVAAQRDGREVERLRPRRRNDSPFRDEPKQTGVLTAEWHQLCDRPVALGDDEAPTSFDLTKVRAQVLPQLPNSDGITHVLKRSTYVLVASPR